jgi:peptidoglycan/LPS O-acetylase OafA/YrhL
MEPKSVGQEEKHLNYLDGIRALSALFVMIGHAVNALDIACLPLISPGYAVTVFMILSGYVMTYQAIQQNPCDNFTGFIKSFYIRRFFRIAPVYFFLLIICYFSRDFYLGIINTLSQQLDTLFIHNSVKTVVATTPSLTHIISHVTFLFGLFPSLSSSVLLPDWSLSLEMQFYLAFPFIFLWSRKHSLFAPVIFLSIAAVGITHFYQPLYTYGSVLPFRLTFFLAGMLLACARWDDRGPKLLWIALAFLCVKNRDFNFTVFLILICDHGLNMPDIPYMHWITSFARQLLGCRIMRFLADVSYSVYLVHPLVILPVGWFLFQEPWFVQAHLPVRFLIGITSITLLTLLVSIPLHYGIEKPGIKLGKRLANRFFHPNASLKKETSAKMK